MDVRGIGRCVIRRDARRICDRANRIVSSGHFPGFMNHIRSNRFSDHGKNQHCRCLLRESILFLSLPAMILTFVVMRKGAPTQPLFAGAVIGILSASLGAMIACVNDGTAFVATWYTAACA